ncbi:MAG: integron integrase [Chloroflexi bacterium]|nr:integron integrase [Chloroflexota bacterium]
MSSPPKPKLADQLSSAIRLRGYSYRTEQSYVRWYIRFVRFHRLRHPAEMGQPEVEAFLTHLVTDLEVSSSTQNQALAALLFLYAEVLKKPLGDVDALRAKKSHYVQPYLSADEVRRILDNLSGVSYLAACIMYGGGLRLMECLRLRLKDIDLDNLTLTAHDTKSNRDRVTFLPGDETFLSRLRAHLASLRRRYEANPNLPVSMPPALARKYRSAATSWEWFYLFPARGPSVDPRTHKAALHHMDESSFQRAVAAAVKRAAIRKRVTAHSLRAAFAHRMAESGASTTDIQFLMGHADPKTTAHYLEGMPPAHTRLRGPLSKTA